MHFSLKLLLALHLSIPCALMAEPFDVNSSATEGESAITDATLLNAPTQYYFTDELKDFPPPSRADDATAEAKSVEIKSTTKIRRTVFDESALNYQCSQNFCVWWDKRFDHADNAADTLKWAEFAWDRSVSLGTRTPIGSETYYVNIYIHHIGTEGAGEDIFPDDWRQAVGSENSMPFYMAPYPREKVAVDSRKPRWELLHEVFHIMQYNRRNVPYNGGSSSWFIEATADVFMKQAIPFEIGFYERDNPWPALQYYSNPAALRFQPQLSIWAGCGTYCKPNNWAFTSSSRFIHWYSIHSFFIYMIRNGYIDERTTFEPLNAVTEKTPQEYFYDLIPNLESIYRSFVMSTISLDFLSEKEKQGWLFAEKWNIDNYRIIENSKPNGEIDNNQFFAELVDNGTNGQITPIEKNQAWSWTTAKIINTKHSIYKVRFTGSLFGNEGTPSNFYMGIILDTQGKLTYQNIEIINQYGEGIINVPAGTILYLAAISTPKRFEGNETFDYNLQIDREEIPSVQHSLAASKVGNGKVTSIPSGIDCGSACNATFNESTNVTLIATPNEEYSFSGWSGACSGTASCTIAMDSNKQVTATFTETPLNPYDPSKPFVKPIISNNIAVVKRPFTIGWQLNLIRKNMPVRVQFAKDGGAYRVIKSAKANAAGVGAFRWKPTKAQRTANGQLQICAVPSKGMAEVCSPTTSITVQ